jgi:4-hydroxythreonine-4-phosphate dehydrogenase
MAKLVISLGDPAGCGPLIALKAIETLKDKPIDFFVAGDKKILERIPLYSQIKNRIILYDVNTAGIEAVRSGYISKLSGIASLNYLNRALEILRREKIKRLVTAPLSKETAQLFLKNFSGHTEYLADYFGVKNVAMMMVSGKIKLILLTRHIPLRYVSKSIDKTSLFDTFSMARSSLRKMFRLKNPKIVVTSLNPHAGIDTFFDKEERLIYKTIKIFGKNFYGPYPSDTLFIKQNLKKYDCIICLYHDQGMIAFKLLSMKVGVNLTLGLPIIRTSPAHGVACDVMRAGRIPFHSSMVAAIKLAMSLHVN